MLQTLEQIIRKGNEFQLNQICVGLICVLYLCNDYFLSIRTYLCSLMMTELSVFFSLLRTYQIVITISFIEMFIFPYTLDLFTSALRGYIYHQYQRGKFEC